MSTLALLLSMAAGVYAIRLSGFALSDRLVPAGVRQALGFTPVAIFTALVVSGLTGRPDDWPMRLIAAVAAGLVAYHTRQVWGCILSGMVVYWLLRLLPGGG